MKEIDTVCHYYGTPDTGLWEGTWESVKAAKGWMRQSDGLRYAMLVFVIDGCIFAREGNHRYRIRDGRLFFVPPLRSFSLSAREGSHIVVCRFRPEEIILLKHPRLSELMRQRDQSTAHCPSLPFNEILVNFLCLMNSYKNAGNATPELFDLKKRELFYLLYNTYGIDELIKLFDPIIGAWMDFKIVVLANYQSVSNLNELAALTNCSRVLFNQRFRKAFGDSPGRWYVARKAEHILEDIKKGSLIPKELVVKYNFSSQPHFSAFCKKRFGKTIKELYRVK